ncbi:unnamed protein product [Candidula unifasciata]|uniref:CWH43-like N-terminal domain-containing protein n=1 Tax=Candidula unifasciata TaxID=100452 RepID=A0A8S3ZF67_9EUPU|nr:unnamed protein product [Candidula unifasciata]
MSRLGLVPVSMIVLAAATFVVSYIVAVARGDVRAAFPYISDTGSIRPESCIFGQFLNVVAFLAFCTMYIRFKAVEAIAHNALYDDRKMCRLNKVALVVGLVSAFGTSVVANFQEGTIVEVVHFIGAALTFIAGVLYCFLQSVLSYHMCPNYNGLRICRIRLSISLVALMGLFVSISAAIFAFKQWNSTEHSHNKFHWSPGDPGYSAHLVSTIGEWVTALTFMFFFFTYAREFDKIELEVVTRPLVQHFDEIPERTLEREVNERTRLLV